VTERRLELGPALAVALVAFVLLSASLTDVWHDRVAITDVPVYQGYGDAIERGDVPYRDFRPEYPPLALVAFAVPSFLTKTEIGYARAFAVEMVVVGLVLIALAAVALRVLRRSGHDVSVLGLMLLGAAPLLLGSLLLSRFDLVPAALVLAVVVAVLQRRPVLASVVAGLAVATKIYPVVLVPILVAFEWRRSGRRAAARVAALTGATVALVYLPFILLAPDGVAWSVWRQLSRPLQIESLGAALLLAGSKLTDASLTVVSSYGSQNVDGWPAGIAAVATSLAQLTLLAAVWWLAARARDEGNRDEAFVLAAGAAVVAFVALGKVLSPQFLIWLLPLVALVSGRRGLASMVLVASACVLTRGWFPDRYWALVREADGWAVVLLVARDLVLVALAALLVAGLLRSRSR
jgi:Glycosyltransferase family 87